MAMMSLPAGLLLSASCSRQSASAALPSADADATAAYLPKAVIYRTTGDCPELVPVSVDASGNALISYPAPSDLSQASTPLQLADGWWLDRRGISPATRFTTYTYAQYSAMAEAPDPAEIMRHLDADCRIAEIRELPMDISAASADTAAVNRLITTGVDQCRLIYSIPTIKPKHK